MSSFGFIQIFIGSILCVVWACGLVKENEIKKQEKLAQLRREAIESGDFSKLTSFEEEKKEQIEVEEEGSSDSI